MKNKDLNRYINDKLDQGNGLPYKEEYWGNMNELLDANMPANAASAAVVKTTAIGLKLLYLSAACAAILGVSYTFLFNPTTENNNPATVTSSQNKTPVQSEADIILSQPSLSQNALTTKADVTHEGSSTETSQKGQTEISPSKNNELNSSSSIHHSEVAHKRSSKSDIVPGAEMAAIIPLANELSATPSSATLPTDESISSVSNTVIDFNYIEPLKYAGSTTEMKGINYDKLSPSAYPKRNRLIQHLDVSPFVSLINEYDKQVYTNKQVEYTKPVQTNYAYGVNVACETKRFTFRTGIGWSQTSMITAIGTDQNIYKVDTNFVVINSNFGTTASGKPIALVQRQIDSSIVSTQHTTLAQTTTYQYLTIPLTLQYRIAYKRFTFVLEGGTLHHIVLSQQTTSPIQQTNSENHSPVQGYNLQLTAGSGLRFAISSQWALGIQYNYNLTPSSANLHLLNNAHVATLMLTKTIW